MLLAALLTAPFQARSAEPASPTDLDLPTRAAQVVFAPPPLRGEVRQAGVLIAGPELGDLQALRQAIARWRSRAPHALLVAADAELGLLHRLHGHPDLPAIPHDPHALPLVEIESMGHHIGRVLRDVGVDLVFAPVADVADRGHLARHGRTAGGDATRVTQVALAYNRGLKRSGLLTIAKHYPGYGDTAQSSDGRAVRVPEAVIAEHAPVFHAVAPHVDGLMLSYGDEAPAAISPERVRAARALAPVLFTDDVFALRATWRREGLAGSAFDAGIHVLVTTAPPDWQPHPHGGLPPRWMVEDPSQEILRHVQDDAPAQARLDDHVCAVWSLMVKAGRRDRGCASGEIGTE